MSTAPPAPATGPTIVLPEDRPIRADVFLMAGIAAQYQEFSGYPYRLQYMAEQITSLSNSKEEISKAVATKVAALKKIHGTIDDIPAEPSVNIRQYSSTILFLSILAVGGAFLIVNSDAPVRAELLSFWNTNQDVVVALLIILAVTYLFVRYRGRRRKAKA